MADGSKVNRRILLRNLTAISSVGIAGCLGGGGESGDDIQDSDGDGVIDSEDYAPNDPEVQEKSDVSDSEPTGASDSPTEAPTETPTEAPTETESYNSSDYYWLPKCDGSKPIQLISVSVETGIIKNLTPDDKLVLVYHGSIDEGQSDGPICGAHLVEGGEEVGYETLWDSYHPSSDPSTVGIKAVPTSEEDYICDQIIPYQEDEYTDGCVDPDSFRG